MNDELQRLIARVRDATGYPVTVSGDPDMATHSRMASASPQRPVHTIFVNPAHERFGDYLVAMQCSMLLAKWADPSQVTDFAVSRDKIDYLAEKVARRAMSKGVQRASAAKYADTLVNGLLLQLASLPLQMMGIEAVHADCPSLAESQGRLSGRQELRDMSMVLSREVRDASPEDIFDRGASMNAAFAHFWSRLAGDTVCVLPYRVLGYAQRGAGLLATYDAVDKSSPGRLRQSVDSWAEILKMRSWYEWRRRDEP